MDKRKILRQKLKEIQNFDENVINAAISLYKTAIAYEPNITCGIKDSLAWIADGQVILLERVLPSSIISNSNQQSTPPKAHTQKVLMFKGFPIPLFSTENDGRESFCKMVQKLCKTREDLLKIQQAALTLV